MFDIRNAAIWALLAGVVVLGAASCTSTTMLKATRAALKTTQDALEQTQKNLRAQKDEAASRLRTETASVLALQARWDSERATQERADAVATKTIDQLRADLARMRAAARRVLDAADGAGRGGRGGGAAPQTSAGAEPGAAGGPKAGGVVPGPEDEEAAEDAEAYEADRINNAYAACRADAFSIRRTE